ncbi:MAG: Na+/H+ antiporter NhaC family protein [Myxococcota bacterium]
MSKKKSAEKKKNKRKTTTPSTSTQQTLDPHSIMEDEHEILLEGMDDAASPSQTDKHQGFSKDSQQPLWQRIWQRPTIWLLGLSLLVGYGVGKTVPTTWTVEQVPLNVYTHRGQLVYTYKGKPKPLPVQRFAYTQSPLHPERIKAYNRAYQAPKQKQVVAFRTVQHKDAQGRKVSRQEYLKQTAKRHWGWWSLLPALVAILLCWVTREPLTSLLGGVLSGAFLLGRYDITESVFMPTMMSKDAAGILLLYLWLLGGLLGIWSRTGAARAFADWMAQQFVRGPKSAKLVAWFLGVLFFQGGTVSTVLVGTTVKPLADKQRVSHEELSYIVDSTASPIASIIAFNAWPGYVQAFIFVPGVAFLATESDRIAFFFRSIPLSFYSIFAVIATFLLSLEKSPFIGKRMREARRRARETGALDAPDAQPLSARELHTNHVPPGYHPHVIEFFLPLGLLIAIAVITFFTTGSPQVRWAFGAAVALAFVMALGRGMQLRQLIEGLGDGLKGVVMGSVILVLAITIGGISRETGGGIFLVELLGQSVPFWLLPVVLQILTIIIAFSTGTSWGTYAVAFPLSMPLAAAIASQQGLAHPQFFMMICFAAVMNGSVFGDQCSPISDTTVLSAMCTGCDLMDHVRTQLPQASVVAALAAICWTLCTFFAI